MKVLGFAVAVFAVLGAQCCLAEDMIDANELVDQILQGARDELTKSGQDQVNLPDIYEGFKKKIGFVRISGHFSATQGWAKSLASLRRTGPATLGNSDSGFTVDVPVGLSDLQLGYSYQAKLGKLGPSGHITASVSSNSIRLRASMRMTDSGCSLGVDSVQLENLGKINVHATGLGQLNFLYSKIVTLVTNKLQGKIQDAANNAIRKAVQKAALKKTCDQLFG